MAICRSAVTSQRYFDGFRGPAGIILGVLIACALVFPVVAAGDEPEPVTVGPVTGAQTMWSIANENRPDNRITIPQYMMAIVERNPDAFIAGNVNLLREGAILEMPTAEEAQDIPRDEAQRLLDEQMEWFAELSRDERVALRDAADVEPPPAIDEPEPVVESDEVVPEPDPAPEAEEGLAAPEEMSEPEPAPVEPDSAPEPVEVIPEPEPDRETEVTIADDVAEPAPFNDPIEDPDPAEPEQEVLPEPPEEESDPILEPEAERELDRPDEISTDERVTGEPPVDEPAAEPVAPPVEEPSPDETAPPATPAPGPEPAAPIAWWVWVAAALTLLLALLVVLGMFRRSREAEVLEVYSSDDDQSPPDDPIPPDDDIPPRSMPGGPSAAAAPAAVRPTGEHDEGSAHSGDDAEDRVADDIDEDSPWARFEDSVMTSDPVVDAPTAVLEGEHPAERIDEESDHLTDEAPAPAASQPQEKQEADQEDEKEPVDADDEVFDLAEASNDKAGLAAENADRDEQEFDWLKPEDDQQEEEPPAEHEDEFDLSEFSRPTSDAANDDVTELPRAESPARSQEDESEFDLTNFDFDDTVVGEGHQTVAQDEEPVDDEADDSLAERPARGLEDLDELMARDLEATGLIGGGEDDKSTEIAPPDMTPDSPVEESDEVGDSSGSSERSTEQPGLDDQEAEVMIDLARLTADGGDTQYARDLLDEVIRDGSERMAEEARKLQASLR
jgi:pilus assembly protein FimV